MTDAIQSYHDLLAYADLAEASHAMLDAELRRHHVVFGGLPLCTVLRPRFLTPERPRAIAIGMDRLLRAFGRVQQAAMADPALRAQFRLAEWEEPLVLADPGYASPSPHGRLDCFEDPATGAVMLT